MQEEQTIILDGQYPIDEDCQREFFRKFNDAEELLLENEVLRNKIEDITGELERVSKKYNTLIDQAPDGIFITDFRGKYTDVNEACTKITGYEANELLGMYIKDTCFKEDFQKGIKELARASQGEASVSEWRIMRKDGSILTTEVSVRKLQDNRLLGVIRDITDRKKNEEYRNKILEGERLLKQAVEYDRLRTDFFANISHELRTPLNVILGALQLVELQESNPSDPKNREKGKKYRYVMKKNCYRLLRLVNNLIDITKIDAGYFSLDMQNHDIINIVEGITSSVVDYAEYKGINLIFDTDVEEKLMAFDEDKIGRVILNLLSNSIKFTPTGGEILVSIHDEGDNVYISVKDTGIGIPVEKQAQIFERFTQIDSSLSRSYEGSGIGLSLVKSLVTMHGGDISVISEYGKGCEIIIKIPFKLIGDSKTDLGKQIQQSQIERINIELSDIY